VPLIGADLRGDAEAPQEAEGPPRDGRVGDIEMNCHLAAAAEVHAAGEVEKPRELGQPVALVPRCDRRELVAEILRE
jgi:hypothetical protein